MKLTKKQKAKWLKALRSGEYEQTTGTLYNKSTQGFCCLGVLQHCLTGGMVEYTDDRYPEPKSTPSLDWYQSKGIVVDLPYASAYYVEDADESTLMDMNDGNEFKSIKKRSFRGIAQWIERNVETID